LAPTHLWAEWQVGSKRALFYPKEPVTARDELVSFLLGLKIFEDPGSFTGVHQDFSMESKM